MLEDVLNNIVAFDSSLTVAYKRVQDNITGNTAEINEYIALLDEAYAFMETAVAYNGSLWTNIENSIIKPFIFTDRSIYRPGQTVYFKGIFLKKTGDKTGYSIYKLLYLENLQKENENLQNDKNNIDLMLKDLEDKFEHEYWTVRMAKQAMLDMISYGRVGTGNLDSILMMSAEQQKQVLSLASSYTVFIDKNINQLMSNATTNSFSIEESLRNQLKLGKADKPDTEKLL